MLRGGVARFGVRALPLALVVALFGVGQADTAGGTRARRPAVGHGVAHGWGRSPRAPTQQFTATGTYSDLTTKNLTDTVTWSTSSSSTATVSNAAGSQGLATGAGTGVATITATAPGALVSGTAALTVTPALPTGGGPTLPATLVAIAVTPPVATVAAGATEHIHGHGHVLRPEHPGPHRPGDVVLVGGDDGHHLDAAGSKGLATGVATGAVTITAADSTRCCRAWRH